MSYAEAFIMELVPVPKDNRCTYRIKKYTTRYGKVKYQAQYKKPNGWVWWSVGIAWDTESWAREVAQDHAVRWIAKVESASRLPIYINLGKLP